MPNTPDNPFLQALPALNFVWEWSRNYVAELPDHPAGADTTAAELYAAFDEPLPETGCSAEEAVRQWLSRAALGITGSSGPRFFGFVTGGTTPASLAGDWIASTIDQNSGLWVGAPCTAHTDEAVLRWLKELFLLPSSWPGTLTSGATMSNLVGLAAGRQWVSRQRGFDAAADGLAGNPPIPVLSSAEIHASAVKSLSTLGFGRNAVRKLPSADGRLELDSLRRELLSIEGPVIVVANAGEVNTGAFDDLHGIADLLEAHPGGGWLHVDGAFGLYANLAPRTRHLLAGLERVDSVACDAHKWLNVPYDSGFAFVRDEAILLETFSTRGAYLEPVAAIGRDLDGYRPVFSTRFRGLPMWCALRAFGRSGYQEMVERCLANAAMFGEWLETAPGVELLAPVRLNMVCWRYVPDELDAEATDQFNRDAVAAIQRDGRVFLTPTRWQGKQAIRCAFDNWATQAADVEILQQTVADFAAGS